MYYNSFSIFSWYPKCSFNLPDIIDRFIQGKNQGLYHEPGLPNITGQIFGTGTSGHFYYNAKGLGAFYLGAYCGNNECFSSQTSGGSYPMNFDASRSSSIYGNSDTVQPKSIELYFYIKY